MFAYRKNLTLIILLLTVNLLGAQSFEWVNFHRGQGATYSGGFATDKSGNQYYAAYFKDSLRIGSTNHAVGNFRMNAVVWKQDANGGVLWSQMIRSSADIYAYYVSFNSAGELIVMGRAMGNLSFPGGATLSVSSGGITFFIATFSTSGTFISARKLLFASTGVGANVLLTNDASDNLYFYIASGSNYLVYDSANSINVNPTSGYPGQLIKFSRSGKTYEWRKEMIWIYWVSAMTVGRDGNIYMSGIRRNIALNYTYAGKSVPNPGAGSDMGIVISVKPNGDDLDFFTINPCVSSRNTSVLSIAAYDSGNVFISGYFKGDSAQIGNQWKGWKRDSTYHFIAKTNVHGSTSWVKMADFSTQPNSFLSIPQYMANARDSFVYLTAQHEWGNVSLSSYEGKHVGAGYQSLMMKLDHLGNVLWAFPTDGLLRGIGTDTLKSCYFTGEFDVAISFGPFSSSPVAPEADLFSGKIIDYSIFRGNVGKGPYCAGDSIKVPYSKLGSYDTANYFIAELSDEEGNFTGGHRELGRLKANKDSVITGLLPTAYVPSSASYRIRIVSTHPQVQSYYKLDTLRLLIYSKDSAEAGPDHVICRGDTVKLQTFGGTQWKWTPAGPDSSARKISVVPQLTTEYRIAISDSSGCGVTDTDYVRVFVREDLRLLAPFNDTIICEGQQVSFQALPRGGDSTKYFIQWYELKANKLKTLGTGGTLLAGCTDSCVLMSKKTGSGTRYIAVLWDSCSRYRDTQFYSISVPGDPKASLHLSKTDTAVFKSKVICQGQSISIYSKNQGGRESSYQKRWYLQNGLPLGSGDSLSFKPQFSASYYYVLGDNCSVKSDTLHFSIYVNPPLKNKIVLPSGKDATDTAICSGTKAQFSAKGTGGDSSNHSFSWLWNDSLVSNSASIAVPPKDNVSGKLVLVLKDNCTSLSDSSEILVDIMAPLKVSANVPDTLCLGENVKLTAAGSGGKAGKYKFSWYWDAVPASQNDSLIIPSASAAASGLHKLELLLEDACSDPADTSLYEVYIRPALKINLAVDSICYDNRASFKANAAGGKSGAYFYSWMFGNTRIDSGNDSFSFSGDESTEIYAIVNDGCSKREDSASLTVHPVPDVTANLDPDESCVPLQTELSITALNKTINSYTWFTGNGDSVKTAPFEYVFQSKGTYSGNLKIVSDKGCSRALPLKPLYAYGIPEASFSFTPEHPNLEKPELHFKNLSQGGAGYFWDFGDGAGSSDKDPQHKYSDSGSYKIVLIVESIHGCRDTVEKDLYVKDLVRIYVPNSFTPDGDGQNEVFGPVLRGITDYRLLVFNRWGEELFIGGFADMWDGNYQGRPCPEGLYFYVLEVRTNDKRFFHYNGQLMLLR